MSALPDDEPLPELTPEQQARIDEHDRERRESPITTMRRHEREQRQQAESEMRREPRSDGRDHLGRFTGERTRRQRVTSSARRLRRGAGRAVGSVTAPKATSFTGIVGIVVALLFLYFILTHASAFAALLHAIARAVSWITSATSHF